MGLLLYQEKQTNWGWENSTVSSSPCQFAVGSYQIYPTYISDACGFLILKATVLSRNWFKAVNNRWQPGKDTIFSHILTGPQMACL